MLLADTSNRNVDDYTRSKNQQNFVNNRKSYNIDWYIPVAVILMPVSRSRISFNTQSPTSLNSFKNATNQHSSKKQEQLIEPGLSSRNNNPYLSDDENREINLPSHIAPFLPPHDDGKFSILLIDYR